MRDSERQAVIEALIKAIREDPYYDSNEAINGLGVCDVRVILNDLHLPEPHEDAISIDWIKEYMKNMIVGSDRWLGVKWLLEDWTKWKKDKLR